MRQCPACDGLFADALTFCPTDGVALSGPDPLLGSVVDGKYAVESVLGRGAMGTVYRATQLHLERRVAMKVVRGGGESNPIASKRFKREAVAIARLKHPNIVTIHDSGEAPGGGAYIVMELVEGPSLRDEIERRGRFALADALEIVGQICAAVAAAHGVGVIHRDLKPENVMIERAGTEAAPAVKVLDFGAAKLHGEQDAGRTTLTSHRTKLGTPMYMSPEQAASQPVDARADVYSIGCVLYEMLAGRPPFVGRSVAMVLLKHRGELPKPPSAHAAGLAPDVDAVVLRALAKEPDERFQSPEELAAALAVAVAAGDLAPAR